MKTRFSKNFELEIENLRTRLFSWIKKKIFGNLKTRAGEYMNTKEKLLIFKFIKNK